MPTNAVFRLSPLALSLASILASQPALSANTLPPLQVQAATIVDITQRQSAGEEVTNAPSADAGEALRAVPGVSGVHMGGHGVDPVIRGQGMTRVNVLIDGAFIHGACPNRMDPPTSYAPIESFEEVTIIKGSHSVVHGAGGSGGTVLFNRRTAALEEGEHWRGKLDLGYRGNSDTKDGSIDITTGSGDNTARAILTAKEADNYKGGDGREVRSAYQEKKASLLLGFSPSDELRLQFSADATRNDDVLYAGAGMDAPFADDDSFRLKASHQAMGPFDEVRAELYNSSVSHSMDNYSLRTAAGVRLRAPSTSDTLGGRLVTEMSDASGIAWTFGADFQNNDREADRFNDTANLKHAVLWPGVSIDQTGLFAEMELPMGRDALIMGVRYDHVSADASRANEAPTQPGTLSPNAAYALYYGKTATPVDEDNLGGFARYEMALEGIDGTVYGGISRTMRTADATERYMGSALPAAFAANRWIGNPGLEPEAHHQIEVGADVRFGALRVDGSVYYNRVTDFILRDRAHGQSGILLADNATIYRNVDAKLYGTELSARYPLSDSFTATAGIAYVHATNTSDNRPIAQTPPLEGTLGLEYQAGDWRVNGRLRMVDRQNRVDDDLTTGSGLDVGKTAGHTTLDLDARWQLSKTTSVILGMDNVFDESYAEHLNKSNAFDVTQVQVNEPGRSAWARLSVKF